MISPASTAAAVKLVFLHVIATVLGGVLVCLVGVTLLLLTTDSDGIARSFATVELGPGKMGMLKQQ